MSTSDRVWGTATALWDSDVAMILNNLYNQGHLGERAEAVAGYIKSNTVFQTYDAANQAKELVKAFNDEVHSGTADFHPLLLDHESSMLFRLGIFDVHEACNTIPEFELRWGRHQEPLDALLKNIEQIAISSQLNDENK